MMIVDRNVASKGDVVEVALGFPTRIGVPVKTEAGMAACAFSCALRALIMQDAVSGAVNVVSTGVQMLPFQYLITLALLKLGSEKANVPETSLKASPFDATSMA